MEKYTAQCYTCPAAIQEILGQEEWYCSECQKEEKYGPLPYSFLKNMNCNDMDYAFWWSGFHSFRQSRGLK